MSDPVTNAEIEDVLSSIRRLVSEEPSPFLNRKRPAPKAPEKFVLTPALRIADTDAAPSTGAPSQDETESVEPEDREETPANVIDPDTVAKHRQTLEQRIVELETALEQSPDEWEPDGSETSRDASQQPLSFDDVSGPADKSGEGEALFWQDVDESSAETFDWREDPDDAEIANIKDVISGDDIDVAADKERGTDEADGALDLGSDTSGPKEISGAVAPAETVDDFKISSEPVDPVKDSDDTDPEKMGDETLDSEPDPTAETTENPAFWTSRSRPDDAADAWDREDGPDATSNAAGTDLFADDGVLDENALREMISEMVREELQGLLGERITRNVRRLVRREIQRALEMRDLQ